jgi:hypothetical protein
MVSARCAAQTSLDSRIGAIIPRDGIACLVIANPGLLPHAAIIVVQPERPQSFWKAEVTGRSNACRADGAAARAYRVRLAKKGEPADGVLVGVLAPVADARIERGSAAVRLEGARLPIVFRTCTSADGVHLTGWAGRPMASLRVWHAYVYLGQDLEPTCTVKETEEDSHG